MPALIRRQPQVVQDAWEQVEAAIIENQKFAQPLPEPYFARSELWIMVGNYDEAMRDLLAAMQAAENRGESLRLYTAVFARLRDALERYDAMPVPPEDGEPSQHYGHGMHTFWAGNYVLAAQDFTNAITLAPNNPLYWYMRAITRRRMGDDKAAKHDVLLGAAAERRMCSRSLESGAEISRQLRRVQGADRLWLEEYRRGNPSRRTMAGSQR